MSLIDEANAKQSAYWNGDAGRRWTELQESQDRLFTEITAALFDAATPKPGEKALDVGCGAGETTLKAASLTGAALGVDVSEPLLARARERAAQSGSPARFALADATAYDFSGEAADLMISRFGVMFFAEPAKSFANLRRGLKPDGRLAFVCWRDPELNPWLTTPLAAALKHLPAQPETAPDDPGPFAFRSEARVRAILESAGFTQVSFSPRDFEFDYADGGGLDNAVDKSLAIGPTSRALDGQPDATVQAVREAVRATLAPYLRDGEVKLGGAVWIVRARA